VSGDEFSLTTGVRNINFLGWNALSLGTPSNAKAAQPVDK